jgi:hypothetical protein
MNQREPSRLTELWCDRALFGLDPHEVMELTALLGPNADDAAFELAAAAIALTPGVAAEAMPADLARRIAERAMAPAPYAADADAAPTIMLPDRAASQPTPLAPVAPAFAPRTPPAVSPGNVVPLARPPRRSVVPWLAAAACLVLAAGGWWKAMQASVDPIALRGTDWTIPEIEIPAPTPAEARAALLESPTAVRIGWNTTDDPSARGASGDVVWDNEAQRGFMRMSGLAKNDPSREQYQLWIFDAEKDERYPVDGGVFDVDANGDVIVEIDAKLSVDRPTLFAVTVEKPGGVVVSSRERIVLTAALSG